MLKKIFFSFLFFLSDVNFAKVLFILKLRYIPNFSNPKSINEKINFLKFYSNNELRKLVVDRLLVRNYVTENTTGVKLINILWSGVSLTNDDFLRLPDKFVLKANHGSGMVEIVIKSEHTLESINSIISKWLNFDYGDFTRERLYSRLKKYALIEEFLSFEGDVPPDYKFICLNGRVELVQIDFDRFNGHSRNLYSRNFEEITDATRYQRGPGISKPVNYENALKCAEELAQKFDFIRVDFFILNNEIYFGELTNFPHNGLEPYSKNFDFELGSRLNLKEAA